ncbi:DUF6630 family protein [Vibrio rhizosphaerae]|uniref:DUF6630 family protein n=1 Tax=Vibrio rhizosphaerae TaxID=398736 RepID=UPI0012F75C25|nr:hypothetical protein [Vibrio rhizosphaerae]
MINLFRFFLKIIIYSIVVLGSPLFLANYYFQRYRLINFLSMLFSGLPDEVQSPQINKIMDDVYGKNHSELIETALYELKEEGYWVNLSIDWRDIDEVEPQANEVIKYTCIQDTFTLSTQSDDESVWQALVTFDIWLQARGYQFVLWDQGSDQYEGFVCDSPSCEKFMKLGNRFGLKLIELDHVNEQ